MPRGNRQACGLLSVKLFEERHGVCRFGRVEPGRLRLRTRTLTIDFASRYSYICAGYLARDTERLTFDTLSLNYHNPVPFKTKTLS